jgi:hypothetical protein
MVQLADRVYSEYFEKARDEWTKKPTIPENMKPSATELKKVGEDVPV